MDIEPPEDPLKDAEPEMGNKLFIYIVNTFLLCLMLRNIVFEYIHSIFRNPSQIRNKK